MTPVPDATSDAPRILVADDSPDQRTALSRILEDAGYQVDQAADGEAVLLFLRNRRADLLLLDLHMPGRDGFDVLAQMQRGRIECPVILLSALPPDEIQQSISRIPARSLPPLLFKPIDPDQLLSIIDLKLGGELPA